MSIENNLISIIVPVYKVEKYLDRCIESILNQTYSNFEVILVDDDSPDNCPRMCDEYAAKYNNIVALHLTNSGFGASGARNAGIGISRGRYITFIDSDDYVHIELLAVLKQGIESAPNVLISMCSYKLAFDLDIELNQVSRGEVKLISDLESMDMLISDQNRSAVWGKLYARELFEDLRFPVGKHNEDMFVLPIIFQKAKKMAVTTQQLYFYYQGSESLCRSTFNYNMLDMIDALFEWKNHVSVYYPSLQEKIDSHYYSTIINYCQYLSKKTDNYGLEKYNNLKNLVLMEYGSILKSEHTIFSNKFKVLLLRFGMFRLFFQIIEFLNIRKYE